MTLIGLLVLLLLVAGSVWWWMGREQRKAGKPAEERPAEETGGQNAENKQLAELRAAAEGGDAVAACRLGKMHAEGLTAEQDWRQAAAWYRKAAQGGNAEGAYQLGRLYEAGNGVGQDWVQASTWYRKAAERGHADAQWKMGLCHRDGRGVARDPIWAKIWLEKAARQGQEEAKVALSQLAVTMGGETIPPAEMDRAEAESGDAAAQCRMGRRCMDGVGVPKDEAAGAEWYRKAAEQGHAEAQCRWGDCLWSGRGTAKDEAGAETWYRAAANQGNAEGQRAMGKCRMAAGGRAEAVAWLKEAANGGDAEGQYLLAVCYQKGMGTEKDPATAKRWLKEAAKNGYAKAKAALGEDSGVASERAKALLARAKQGDRRAQFELGRELMSLGREKDGTGWIQAAAQGGLAEAAIWMANHWQGKDPRQSFTWWSRAADSGSPEAQWRMVDLCRSGTGTTPNDTEALRWARKAAEGGNRRAMLQVAEFYEKGVGCRQDYQEAKRWYARAGNQYEVERMDRLISGNSGAPSGGEHKGKGIYKYLGKDGRLHTRTR